MKKITKLLAGAFALAGLLLTGCNNLVDDGAVTESYAGSETGTKRTVIVTASGSTENVKFDGISPDSRTIVPDALDGNNLHFYFWYTNDLKSSTTYPKEETTFYPVAGSNGREGTIEIDLETSKYTMYLAATTSTVTGLTGASGDDNKVKAEAVLFATATVDMRYSERASFYLTPYAVPNGKGVVDLSVYAHDWADDVFSAFTASDGQIVIGMYDINTNAAIQGALTAGGTQAAAVTSLGKEAEEKFTDKSGAHAPVNYKWVDVKPGTYNFKVSFINGDKTYVWSDTIIVLANQTVSKTIPVPNVAGTKPVAPTSFEAYYHDPDLISGDYYDVEFAWTDASNNERNFVIELLDITALDQTTHGTNIATVTAAAAGAATDTAWTTLATAAGPETNLKKFDNSVYADPKYYVAGSLGANQKYVVLNLPLGNLYLARIFAANDAGNSTPVYCKIDTTTATPAVAAGTIKYQKNGVTGEITAESFDDSAVAIGRFKISYHLGRGKYISSTYSGGVGTEDIPSILKAGSPAASLTATQAEITTLDGTTSVQTVYYSQLAAGNKVLNPLMVANENTTNVGTYPTFALFSGNYYWTAWKLNSQDGHTVYNLNRSNPLASQDLNATADTGFEAYVNPYMGHSNINLFAIYGAASVDLYSPADDDFVDYDVLVYKSAGNTPVAALSSAIQVTSIKSSGEFNLDTSAYGSLYIAVRNKMYANIDVEIKDSVTGEIYHAVSTTKASIEAPRYVKLTSKPADFDSAGADTYYKFDATSGKYVGNAATPTWAGTTWYRLDDDGSAANNYTYFTFKTGTSWAAQSYKITVNGYTPRSPKAPMTKQLVAIGQQGATYSKSQFPPLSGTLTDGEYWKSATPDTSVAANKQTTWATTDCFQKD